MVALWEVGGAITSGGRSLGVAFEGYGLVLLAFSSVSHLPNLQALNSCALDRWPAGHTVPGAKPSLLHQTRIP